MRYIVLGTSNSSAMEGKRWKDIISSDSQYLVLTSDSSRFPEAFNRGNI